MKNSASFHNWSIAPVFIQTSKDDGDSGIRMIKKQQQNRV